MSNAAHTHILKWCISKSGNVNAQSKNAKMQKSFVHTERFVAKSKNGSNILSTGNTTLSSFSLMSISNCLIAPSYEAELR